MDLAIAPPLLKIIAGLALIFIASRIVGLLVKVIGIGFLLFAGYEYYMIEKLVSPDVVVPALVGLGLALVGRGVAESAVRIAGLVVLFWGLYKLGTLQALI